MSDSLVIAAGDALLVDVVGRIVLLQGQLVTVSPLAVVFAKAEVVPLKLAVFSPVQPS